MYRPTLLRRNPSKENQENPEKKAIWNLDSTARNGNATKTTEGAYGTETTLLKKMISPDTAVNATSETTKTGTTSTTSKTKILKILRRKEIEEIHCSRDAKTKYESLYYYIPISIEL